MVTVVDYGVGNLRSVAKALEAAGAEVCVSAEAADLRRADRLVLPGVGAFAVGMANLLKTRLVDALTREVREERIEVLRDDASQTRSVTIERGCRRRVAHEDERSDRKTWSKLHGASVYQAARTS